MTIANPAPAVEKDSNFENAKGRAAGFGRVASLKFSAEFCAVSAEGGAKRRAEASAGDVGVADGVAAGSPLFG